MQTPYSLGQPSPQEMLELTKTKYLEIINYSNPQDKETLIAQINQATTTSQMHQAMQDRRQEMKVPPRE